ncbi:UTP--glucose-1-phosphate uridylyltransferase isoform X2 [Arachis duranensis]|uniref:UTP--glucose-1-phosphate uridylyltransferase n=1 Tax=Arachis duranensis TaxID=130453 RepID=A0A6P5MUR0_ARADU|nr:UTP--glucose-1-phosphate uridylyltransferase isoform X2 [Arachis duranensis]
MTVHSIVIQKLLSTNAQMGRRVAAHHLKEYTYGMRNKMAIIDSDKTLICMRSALNFMGSLASRNGRFMFINTNPLFDDIFHLMTTRVGSYSPSTNSLWRTGGFLTNSYSPKKFRSRNKKLVFGPTQPPDCIFILDTDSKSSVINEAHNLHIPVVAIVDSSMPLHSFSRVAYPVPANPSVQFVYLFCNLLTKTLLLEKEKGKLKEAAPLQIQAGEAAKIDLPNLDVTVFPYATLPPLSQDMEETKKLLDKLVVLKFDAASPRDMGLEGPKSAVGICNGLTFLDLIINQIQTLYSKYGCKVPLLLLSKDDTHDNTLKVLEKYQGSTVDVQRIKQGEGEGEGLELESLAGHYSKEDVGHPFYNGDIFRSLMTSGTLDFLLSQGKEYILLINKDNVATVIDPNILNHLVTNDIECCMEVTPSNSFHLISTPMNFKLWEIAQNQTKHENFKLIDTTNTWVSLSAIKRLVDSHKLKQKKSSVLKFFDKLIGVSVPEPRFLPLDATSDLLLLQSDLYTCKEGVLTRNPARTNPLNPVIDLGPEFQKVGDFQSRFKSIPSIVGLDSLTVRGNVWFGANITFKGQVAITAKPGLRLEIPDGVVIENKVVANSAMDFLIENKEVNGPAAIQE